MKTSTRSATLELYRRTRQQTLDLCDGLSAEDLQVQSMPDASPGKWHLAHTTWFFEHFVLGRDGDYRAPHTDWHYLFNSYYQSVGPMHARPHRGLITRPSLEQVRDWRLHVDEAVCERLGRDEDADLDALVNLGLNHEQQHQELLVTDLLHAFWCNPLKPAYRPVPHDGGDQGEALPLRFVAGREGIVEIGHAGDAFAFDNETPRHRTLLQPHALANRLVTNAEYGQFIRDGGYREPTLWLSDGWSLRCAEDWSQPMYWDDDHASAFGIHGVRALDPDAPVTQLSYFEADAFARWAGARLPTEAEWEDAAARLTQVGNLCDGIVQAPAAAAAGPGLQQMYGDVWEWTGSPYVSYPGFRPLPGSLGEYNGKFMCAQWVLRGGSCATARDHMRASYRNFFPAQARWQFSGLRLARDG